MELILRFEKVAGQLKLTGIEGPWNIYDLRTVTFAGLPAIIESIDKDTAVTWTPTDIHPTDIQPTE